MFRLCRAGQKTSPTLSPGPTSLPDMYACIAQVEQVVMELWLSLRQRIKLRTRQPMPLLSNSGHDEL